MGTELIACDGLHDERAQELFEQYVTEARKALAGIGHDVFLLRLVERGAGVHRRHAQAFRGYVRHRYDHPPWITYFRDSELKDCLLKLAAREAAA